MKIAIIGVTGLVGRTILKVLEERNFEITELIPVASPKSKGTKIIFKNKEYTVCTLADALKKQAQIAIFSAGAEVSKQWAPQFAKAGCRVVDNSSFWRMDPSKKLIIPEINANELSKEDMIIANPNCSTIQMLVAIAQLHKRFIIKRIVVSTYQCITGTGKKALDQLEIERQAIDKTKDYIQNCNIYKEDGGTLLSKEIYKSNSKHTEMAYPYQIDLNVLPHIDSFLENGYTKEETKMIDETHKILGRDIMVSPTAVRIPVIGGHSESINLEFSLPINLEEVMYTLKHSTGVELVYPYPMPLFAKDKDQVFVGRVRLDKSIANGLNLWCVADNLRKGAATNAVQIAELLIKYINNREAIL